MSLTDYIEIGVFTDKKDEEKAPVHEERENNAGARDRIADDTMIDVTHE